MSNGNYIEIKRGLHYFHRARPSKFSRSAKERYLASPKNLRSERVRSDTASLGWARTPGAKFYRIYRVNNGIYSKIKDTTSTHTLVGGLRGRVDVAVVACKTIQCSAPVKIRVSDYSWNRKTRLR